MIGIKRTATIAERNGVAVGVLSAALGRFGDLNAPSSEQYWNGFVNSLANMGLSPPPETRLTFDALKHVLLMADVKAEITGLLKTIEQEQYSISSIQTLMAFLERHLVTFKTEGEYAQQVRDQMAEYQSYSQKGSIDGPQMSPALKAAFRPNPEFQPSASSPVITQPKQVSATVAWAVIGAIVLAIIALGFIRDAIHHSS